ncbi:tetratricopeptide repeat protein [Aureitalea marina]|uniref:Uncharacterized protein n=1 Tax=Aureitalea marina TaxID=930804 RepID=A0A2S7KT01_9FLAO|nr:tetratricopeptide repeat protein [Aureitalea marina]PQB05759.1 hypothetical protein BST85_13300 [Aureitalea marina]
MIKKLIIFFLVVTSQIYSQNLEEKFRDEVCKCLGKKFSKNVEDFQCFKPLVEKYAEEIDEFVTEDDRGIFHYPSDFFEYFLYEYQQYYLENCGSYFESLKFAYDEGIRISLQQVESTSFEKLNRYIEEYEFNSKFILERGILYLREDNYNSALADFDRLVREDSTDYRAMVLKAVSLEKMGEYNRSSQVYTDILNRSKDIRYKLFAELMIFMGKENK